MLSYHITSLNIRIIVGFKSPRPMYFSCFLSSQASEIWRTRGLGLNKDNVTLLSCVVFRDFSKIQEHFESLMLKSDSFCSSKITVMFMCGVTERTGRGHQCGISGYDTPPRPKPRPAFLSYHHHPKHFIQVQYGPAKCNVLVLNIHAFLFSQLFIFILYGKAYIFII